MKFAKNKTTVKITTYMYPAVRILYRLITCLVNCYIFHSTAYMVIFGGFIFTDFASQFLQKISLQCMALWCNANITKNCEIKQNLQISPPSPKSRKYLYYKKYIWRIQYSHLILLKFFSIHHTYIPTTLWCSGSHSRLAIRKSGVRIPLGAYALRQGILSTIVSLDPGVVNGYPAGIYSFECS